jgi:hypothetical protein
MSLRVQTNSSQTWELRGPANAVMSNRAAASVSFFIQVNTASPGGSIRFPLHGFLNVQVGGGDISLQATLAGGTTIGYGFPYVVGATYHCALVLDAATPSQKFYVDGYVGSTDADALNTLTGSYTAVVGQDAAGVFDGLIEDFAVWNNYLLTGTDILNLRNGAVTPGQISTVPAGWWTFHGTPGNAVQVGDGGLADQSSNGFTFATISTSGGGTGTWAGALSYTPPVTITGRIAKRGQPTFFFAGRTDNGQLQPVTAISSDPTVKVNGSTVAKGAAVWSNVNHYFPFVSYLLQCGRVTGCIPTNGGKNYSASPTISATGVTFGTPVMGVGVTDYTVTGGGSGYTQNFSQGPTGGTGTGARVLFTVSAGQIVAATPTVTTPQGYGLGYTLGDSLTVPTSGAGGSGATVTANVSRYIQYVPVNSSNAGMTAAPTINVSDSTGTGAAIVPIMSGPANTDTVTFDAADAWLSTGLGFPAATTAGSVGNYVGQDEPALGGIPAFNFPANQRTLQAGANGPIGSPFNFALLNFIKNRAHNIAGGSWTSPGGTVTVAADGTPSSWTGGYVYNYFNYNNPGNGVDSRASPGVPGTFTIQFTDPNASGANAMVCLVAVQYNDNLSGQDTLGGSPGAGWNGHASTYNRAVNGTTVTITYTVSRINSTNPDVWGVDLLIQFSNPLKQYTISNLTIVPPKRDNSAESLPSGPVDVHDNFTALCTTPNGKHPACIRTLLWNSNYVEPADLPNVTDFSWESQYSRTIHVTTIRTYDTGAGGTAWGPTNKIYGTADGSVLGWSGTDGFGHYASVGSADMGDWMSANTGTNPRITWVGECVCSAPHGLSTGHILDFGLSGAPLLPVTNGSNPNIMTAVPTYGQVIVAVTGASTFVFRWFDGVQITNGAHCKQVVGSNTVSFDVIFRQPLGQAFSPPEVQGAVGGALPGTMIYTTVPYLGSDALQQEWIRRIMLYADPTNPIGVEFNNEPWNNSGTYHATLSDWLGALLAYAPNGTHVGRYSSTGVAITGDQWYTYRASQVQDVIQTWLVNNGHNNPMWRIFGTQFGDGGFTQAIVNNANAANIPMGAICSAPYVGFTGDYVSWNGGGVTGDSVVGTINSTGGQNWPVFAMTELLRYVIKYSTDRWTSYENNGKYAATYTGPTTDTITGRGVVGQVGGKPAMIGYEGGVAGMVPQSFPPLYPATVNNDYNVAQNHDAFYLGGYELERTFLEAAQLGHPYSATPGGLVLQAGVPGLTGNWGTGGTAFYINSLISTEEQYWGLGDGSLDGGGAHTVNKYTTASGGAPGDGYAYDHGNVAPMMQAWRDWIDGAAPVAPAGLPWATLRPRTAAPPLRRWMTDRRPGYVGRMLAASGSAPVLSVAARNPAIGAIGVGVGARLQVVFDRAVDPASLRMGLTSASGSIAGAVVYDPAIKAARFKPRALLNRNTNYTLTLSAANGLDGSRLNGPVTWPFRTGSSDGGHPALR